MNNVFWRVSVCRLIMKAARLITPLLVFMIWAAVPHAGLPFGDGRIAPPFISVPLSATATPSRSRDGSKCQRVILQCSVEIRRRMGWQAVHGRAMPAPRSSAFASAPLALSVTINVPIEQPRSIQSRQHTQSRKKMKPISTGSRRLLLRFSSGVPKRIQSDSRNHWSISELPIGIIYDSDMC